MNRGLLSLAAFCLSLPVLAQDVASEAVNMYIEAYNAHDVDRMLDLVTDDVRWMSLKNDKVTVEAKGKSELSESMASYFEGLPSTRARIVASRTIGQFVMVIEESGWESKGEMKSQCAISVYEMKEQLILNVWYFDSSPCDAVIAQ